MGREGASDFWTRFLVPPGLWLLLLFAVPILGERLEVSTLLFSLAVVATVFVGRRMPVRR